MEHTLRARLNPPHCFQYFLKHLPHYRALGRVGGSWVNAFALFWAIACN